MLLTLTREEITRLGIIDEIVEVLGWDGYALLEHGIPDQVELTGTDVARMRAFREWSLGGVVNVALEIEA